MRRLDLLPVNEHGVLVAKPAVDGVVELVSYRLGRGRLFVGEFGQAVKVNPSSTVLDCVISGLVWRAYLRRGDPNSAKTLQPVTVSRAPGGGVAWTQPDGRPVAHVIVEANDSLELVWGVDVTVALLPSTLVSLAGSIRGWDAPTSISDAELLALVRPL